MTHKVAMTVPQMLRNECSYQGYRISLTPYEANLVSTLLVRRGRATAMGDLLASLWPNPDDEPEWSHAIVHAYLTKLRRKLPGAIVGRYGYGWGLE